MTTHSVNDVTTNVTTNVYSDATACRAPQAARGDAPAPLSEKSLLERRADLFAEIDRFHERVNLRGEQVSEAEAERMWKTILKFLGTFCEAAGSAEAAKKNGAESL